MIIHKHLRVGWKMTVPCFPGTALVAACLLSILPAPAGEPFVLKPPLQRHLEALVIPEVHYRGEDFSDALVYLQVKARNAPQNPLSVPIVVNLPADFKPRSPLAVDLKAVPWWRILGYLCTQAGVECSIERNAVSIRPAGSAAKATVRTELPAPAAPAGKGLAGPLGKEARTVANGDHVHRAISGEIQPTKSGYVKHRNSSGWSVIVDPFYQLSENCLDHVKCQAFCCDKEKDGCGCHLCSCNNGKAPVKPKPAPKP